MIIFLNLSVRLQALPEKMCPSLLSKKWDIDIYWLKKLIFVFKVNYFGKKTKKKKKKKVEQLL